jgi:Domain of unknown function (DUF222)
MLAVQFHVRPGCYAVVMENELEQLGARIAEQAAHLDAAMHRLLADLRAFDARGGWHAQGAASCAHWLAWRVGWDLVTARDHVRVARKLAEFPAIDDALRRGEVSYSKVRAMLRVATPENEVLLLEHAKLMTASQLEKLCRKYAMVQRHGQDRSPHDDEQRRYVRRRDTEDGMVKIEAVLHPEQAEMVWAMLNHAATQLVPEPSPRSASDSAESGAGPRVHATPAGRLPAAAVLDGRGPAAGVISDGAVAPTITSSVGDAAEPVAEVSPAACSEVGLVAPRPVVPRTDSRPDTAARVIGDRVAGEPTIFPPDDSAESAESCAMTSSQSLSEMPRRSVLDRLLDEADALREADRRRSRPARRRPRRRPRVAARVAAMARHATGAEETVDEHAHRRGRAGAPAWPMAVVPRHGARVGPALVSVAW